MLKRLMTLMNNKLKKKLIYPVSFICTILILFTTCHEKDDPALEYEIYTVMLEDKLEHYSRERNIQYREELIQDLKEALTDKDKIPFMERSLIKRMYETHGEDAPERIESFLLYIQKIYEGQLKSPSSVVLAVDTEHKILNEEFASYNDYLQTMQSFDKYMFNDFIKKNEQSVRIQPIEKFGDKITYLSSDSIAWIFRELNIPTMLLPEAIDEYYDTHEYGWDRFHYEFGDQPIIHFSRPGFNKDKTKALIYIEYSDSPESGRGFFHILEKQNEKWMITEDLILWMS